MNKVKYLIDKYKNMSMPVKAALWYTICSIIQKGISFFIVPIYVRILTIEEYGRYSSFQSWRDILVIFATLNLFCGVYTRGLVNYSEDKDRYTSSLQSLGSLVSVIFLAVYLCLHSFWNSIFELDTMTMLLMCLYFIFSPSFSFWSAKQRVEYKYKKMIIVTIIASLFIPLLSLVLLFCTNLREKSVIFGFLIVEIILGLTFYIYNLVKGKCLFDKKYWKEALKFNIPLIPHYLSLIILAQCDRIMIQKMCGDGDVGLYNFAYQIAVIINVFLSAINNALVPWQYQKLKANEEKEMGGICSKIAIVIAIMDFLIITIAPEVVMILGTKEYMKAIWVIPPITLSSYFTFTYGLFSTVEFYYGKTHYITIASIAGAIMNIILNFIFIKLFGFISAGFTSLACYIFFMIMHYIFMKKVCKQNNVGYKIYNTKFLFLFGLMLVAIIPLFMFLYNYNIVRYVLLAVCLVLVIIYRNKILSIFKNILSKKG